MLKHAEERNDEAALCSCEILPRSRTKPSDTPGGSGCPSELIGTESQPVPPSVARVLALGLAWGGGPDGAPWLESLASLGSVALSTLRPAYTHYQPPLTSMRPL